jgi:hypothetical protein
MTVDLSGPSMRENGDWGKTKPFWCAKCGEGFESPLRVHTHYDETGHGNATRYVGARGLSESQERWAFSWRNK